jgi:hypothetical protein
VYLKPAISISYYIQVGPRPLKIARKVSLVMLIGIFRKTKVTYCPCLSLSLFSVTRSTSQPCPITSFCEEVTKLKYAKEADISSANLKRMEFLPL